MVRVPSITRIYLGYPNLYRSQRPSMRSPVGRRPMADPFPEKGYATWSKEGLNWTDTKKKEGVGHRPTPHGEQTQTYFAKWMGRDISRRRLWARSTRSMIQIM